MKICKEQFSVVNLEQFGHNGWEWDITDGEDVNSYRTNYFGEGLWQYLPSNVSSRNPDGSYSPVYEYRQILGTGQFRLSSNRVAARKAIRRFFNV